VALYLVIVGWIRQLTREERRRGAYILLGLVLLTAGAQLLVWDDPAWVGVFGVLLGGALSLAGQWALAGQAHRQQLATGLLDHRIQACVDFATLVEEARSARWALVRAAQKASRSPERENVQAEDAAWDEYFASSDRARRALWQVRLLTPPAVATQGVAVFDAFEKSWTAAQTFVDAAPAERPALRREHSRCVEVEVEALDLFRDRAAESLQGRA
jgi:enamine deaminase RidA (YjgF/YER057c/UK114 family)